MICCLYTGQQSTQGNSRDSRQLTAWYPQSILFYYLLSLHSTTVVTADSWQHAIHSQYYFMISCLYTGQQSWQQTADSMISTVNIILLFVVSTQYNSHASMLVLSPVYTVQYTVEHTVEYTQYTTQDNSHDSWHHTGEGVNSYIYLHRSPIVPLLMLF